MKLIRVKSFTDPNIEYTVRQTEDGDWLCSCPNFLTRAKQIIICKHLGKVIHDEKAGVTTQTTNADTSNPTVSKSVREQRNGY